MPPRTRSSSRRRASRSPAAAAASAASPARRRRSGSRASSGKKKKKGTSSKKKKKRDDSDERVWVVKAIIGKRSRQGHTEYLVDWAADHGHSYAPTWEPESSFLERSLLDAYEATLQKQQWQPQQHDTGTQPRGRRRQSSGSRHSGSSSRSPTPTPRPHPQQGGHRASKDGRARQEPDVAGAQMRRPKPTAVPLILDDSRDDPSSPPSWASPRRWLGEAAALGLYAVNFIAFTSVLLFSGNLGYRKDAGVLGHTVDGGHALPLNAVKQAWCDAMYSTSTYSLLRSLGVFALFVLQHSLQGRMRAQKKTAAVFGRAGERALHLLGSCVAIHLLQRYWQPMPCTVLWHLPSLFRPGGVSGVSALSVVAGTTLDLGFFLSVVFFFLCLGQILWYDLFQYRQACMAGLSSRLPPVPQIKGGPPCTYRVSRMPLFTALMGCMWMTSSMSLGRFLWSVLWSVYTLLGCLLQERELLRKEEREQGPEHWGSYMRRVPRLLPWPLGRPTTRHQQALVKQGPSHWIRLWQPQ